MAVTEVDDGAPDAAGGNRAAAPPRERRPSGFSHLVLHLHPRVVPADALRLPRTFALGGASLVLFLLLVATGALLLTAYEPSPERAYGTVTALVDEVRFGAFVRNVHHWAANGLVLAAFLHLLRVVYRGGHLPPRRGNWLVGVALLLAVLASAFTGYLLPWDQLAYWAVTIATGMLDYVPGIGPALVRAARGGAEIGSATLARFFVFHVAILPALLVLLLAFHFWLVRKAGGVVLPREVGDEAAPRGALVPTSPALTQREAAAALAVVAATLLAAALADAPLLAQANPGVSPNPAKAPWYFMGVQELLVHVHPLLGAAVAPVAAVALLAALPWLGGDARPSGRWFESARGARLALASALAGAVLTAGAILANEPLRRTPPWFPALPPAVRGGVLPALAAIAAGSALALAARRRGASRLEIVQCVFTFAIAALVVLTATGVLFRGQAMALAWPWRPLEAP